MMGSKELDVPVQDLKEALSYLYESKLNTDLEIVCGKEVFRVHSCLIWSRSKFFEVACHGPFNEAVNKRIELPDDKPDMVHRMIRYFYLLDYQDFAAPPEMYDNQTMVNAEMYALADKYDIKGLKKHAVRKMRCALTLAVNQGPQSTFASKIAILIPIIYNTTPDEDRGLRDCITPFAFAFWKELSALDSFKDLMLATPGFVIDIVGKVSSTHETWYPTYSRPYGTPEARAQYPICQPHGQHRNGEYLHMEGGAWPTQGQMDLSNW